MLAFTRTRGSHPLLCVFNLGAESQTLTLPHGHHTLADAPFATATLDGGTLRLPAYAAAFLRRTTA